MRSAHPTCAFVDWPSTVLHLPRWRSAPSRRRRRIAGRSSAASPPCSGRPTATLPDNAQAAVDLRSRRRDGVVGGDRRWRGLRRIPDGRAARGRIWPTASREWKYTASDIGIGESSPAVAGGIVYIGDLCGVLHAVDAASGKAVWTFKTDGEVKSSPVVAGDTVLIGSYDSSSTPWGPKTASCCGR